MNPAFSVISFTTIAGAAQGLVVACALLLLSGSAMPAALTTTALVVALVMLAIGLGASFLHLGHPERAWRAMLMWRTSWLSREVIVLPAFMGVVSMWLLVHWLAPASPFVPVLALAALALAALLWLCTAQIYACLRFIQEWAHPLTLANYTLIGLASGVALASALAATWAAPAVIARLGPAALVLTLAAWATRAASLRRNARLKPQSTAQSATGIQSQKLVQKSMGMSAGSFNTREFFHGASLVFVRNVRLALHGLGFGLPALLMLAALTVPTAAVVLWWLAVAVQVPGVFAERWLFFAQARHPQNIYYQVVS